MQGVLNLSPLALPAFFYWKVTYCFLRLFVQFAVTRTLLTTSAIAGRGYDFFGGVQSGCNFIPSKSCITTRAHRRKDIRG